MSTTLISEEDGWDFSITRYYGGSERGICYQITNGKGEYTSLTKYQICKLIEFLYTTQYF